MSYQQTYNEHMRIAILRLLEEQADYTLNESLMRDQLAVLTFSVSLDKLRTQANWLAEQELVSLAEVVGMKIIKLTARGADVAKGRAIVPGVKRPSPKA